MQYKTGKYYSIQFWFKGEKYGREYKNQYKTLKTVVKLIKSMSKLNHIDSIMVRENNYSVNRNDLIIGADSPFISWNKNDGFKWYGLNNPYGDKINKTGYIKTL